MITPSLIYAGITILLALVDAIRIKVRWGKTGNIDHKVSIYIAIFTICITACLCTISSDPFGGRWILRYLVVCVSFLSTRLAIFDPALNFFRILTKTNPTMRLDYVSTETSSYEDQHSEKLGFWQKRALAVTAWAVLFVVYSKIFPSL